MTKEMICSDVRFTFVMADSGSGLQNSKNLS
jgi:hypothetical protein